MARILIAALGWLAGLIAAACWGLAAGQDRCEAAQAREDHLSAAAAQSATQAAAMAISQIKVQHATITQQLEREIRQVPVYSDCRVPAGGLQQLNAALTGPDASGSAGDGELPAADGAD
jgi:Tfp pilus assembly protein PilO